MSATIIRLPVKIRRGWWFRRIPDGRWEAVLIDGDTLLDRVRPDAEWRVAMLVNDRRRGLPIVRVGPSRGGAPHAA